MYSCHAPTGGQGEPWHGTDRGCWDPAGQTSRPLEIRRETGQSRNAEDAEHAEKADAVLALSAWQGHFGVFLPFPSASLISSSRAASMTFSPGLPTHLFAITPWESMR